jgi:hypothetical protein
LCSQKKQVLSEQVGRDELTEPQAVRIIENALYNTAARVYAPSVQRGGVVEIIANDQGHRITPSWVSFTDDERLYDTSHSIPAKKTLIFFSVSVTALKMLSTPTQKTLYSMLSVLSDAKWMIKTLLAT